MALCHVAPDSMLRTLPPVAGRRHLIELKNSHVIFAFGNFHYSTPGANSFPNTNTCICTASGRLLKHLSLAKYLLFGFTRQLESRNSQLRCYVLRTLLLLYPVSVSMLTVDCLLFFSRFHCRQVTPCCCRLKAKNLFNCKQLVKSFGSQCSKCSNS